MKVQDRINRETVGAVRMPAPGVSIRTPNDSNLLTSC